MAAQDTEGDSEEYDDSVEAPALSEEYDDLQKKHGKVTVFTVLKWVKDLIDANFLSKEELYEIVAGVLKRTSAITDKEAKTIAINKEQFFKIAEDIDALTESEDEDEDDFFGSEDEYEDDEEYDEGDEEEMLQERQALFNRLLRKEGDQTIRLSDLKKEEDVQELFNEGLLNNQVWKEIVLDTLGEEASLKTAQLNFDQFNSLLDQLQQIIDEEDEEDAFDFDDEEEEEEEEDGGKTVVDTEAVDVPSSRTKKEEALPPSRPQKTKNNKTIKNHRPSSQPSSQPSAAPSTSAVSVPLNASAWSNLDSDDNDDAAGWNTDSNRRQLFQQLRGQQLKRNAIRWMWTMFSPFSSSGSSQRSELDKEEPDDGRERRKGEPGTIRISDFRFSPAIHELIEEGSVTEREFAILCQLLLSSKYETVEEMKEISFDEYNLILDHIYGEVQSLSPEEDVSFQEMVESYQDDKGDIPLSSVFNGEFLVEVLGDNVIRYDHLLALVSRVLKKDLVLSPAEVDRITLSKQQLYRFLNELRQLMTVAIAKRIEGEGAIEKRRELFEKLKRAKEMKTIRTIDLKKSKGLLPWPISEDRWKEVLQEIFGDVYRNTYEINFLQFNEILNRLWKYYNLDVQQDSIVLQ